ncbi:MAG: MG2 domain-containing protein, partial [Planctomycetota bacterium]
MDDSENKRFAAVSLYRKAMFFRRVGPLRDSEKPLPLLDGLLAKYPKDELADEALYVTGMILEGKEDFLGAKARYERLEKDYSESKWISDGKVRTREMERPRIAVDSSGVRLPGGGQEVKVRSRNVKSVSFAAFPVELKKIFEDRRNDSRRWGSYFDRFLREGGARRQWGLQEAEWEFETKDAGDHKWVESKMIVPVENPGAYVLEGRGGSVVHTSALVLSDLALIRKMDGTRLILLAVNADTGVAEPGVKLAVRQKYWVRGGYRTEYAEGETGEDGVYVQKLNPTGNRSKNVQVLAWTQRRYAATGMRSWYWRSGGISPELRVYAYTDRPVYRPKQTVNFKALLRMKRGGDYTNFDDVNVHVLFRDPKGKTIYDEHLTTNQYGGISGKLTLGEEPPLGEYRMRVAVAGHKRVNLSRGARFRVEEYKKPEFEVTVSTDEPQIKLGTPFKAKITARYYFGGPVTDSKVTYRVFRRDYRHSYVPSGEFDWLYGRGYGWRPWWYYFWGPWRRPAEEMVASGEAKTDAEGNATVEIDTEKYVELGKELGEKAPDHLFTVKAEVMDNSRRTIEGNGQIKVTRSEYYAFIETPRGFFEKGERAKFEILTQNATGAPVKAEGKIRVNLLIPPEDPSDKDAKPTRKELISEDLTTDGSGRGWFRFVPDKEGQYEVAFHAKDSWGGEVVGRREIWAVGDEFEGWRFRFSNVEILTDKRSYEEGETAKIMVNTNHKGAHVLFSLEAGNEVMEYRVLAMDSKSKVIHLKLEKAHVPNFFIRAALFARGIPYMEDREIFVPPAKQFLDVTVEPGKAEFKPGEKANYKVKVLDRRGNPVQCEVSLGVIDRSILYIQPEYAPDVRKYFYGDRRRMSGRPDNSLQHGFSTHAEDSAFYAKIKTHGNPPGWWGYGHWRDDFSNDDREQNLAGGVRFDRGPGRGGAGFAEGGEEPAEESESLDGEGKGGAAPPGAPAASGAPMTKGKSRRGRKSEELRRFGGGGKKDASANGGTEKKATVRKNFADTAFWTPVSVTGKNGETEFEFVFPDSLTSWKARAIAADSAARVGNGNATVVTKKNLIVRLAAPRFFTERDEVFLSGIVNNYLSQKKQVRFELTLEGGCLEAMEGNSVTTEVDPKGTQRVNFLVKAVKE